MTKYLTPDSKSYALTAVAKDEPEKEAIKYFKEVCRRDGLEMRSELIKLIKDDWVKRHPKPGNPQKQLFQFDKVHEESSQICECDIEYCRKPAVFRCKTIFPVNPDKNLCRSHTFQFECGNEITEKRKIK